MIESRFQTLLALFFGFFCSFSAAANTPTDWTQFEPVLSTQAQSPEDLGEQIALGYASDMDRAAAIFYWVTQNIGYDTELMRKISSGKKQRYTAEEIERLHEARIDYARQKRRGVCENYARLYQRIGTSAGLEVEMIRGHARGDYLSAGTLGIGHAWNAVKIDGQWRLLDATRGSGHLSGGGQFEREFKPQYFLPNPKTLAYSHYPNDADWQLLASPVGQKTYLNRPSAGEAFLKYDLRGVNYDQYQVETKRGVDLIITGAGNRFPEQFICANLSTGQQVPCKSRINGEKFTVRVEADRVKNMKFGLLNELGEIILAYQIRVK